MFVFVFVGGGLGTGTGCGVGDRAGWAGEGGDGEEEEEVLILLFLLESRLGLGLLVESRDGSMYDVDCAGGVELVRERRHGEAYASALYVFVVIGGDSSCASVERSCRGDV